MKKSGKRLGRRELKRRVRAIVLSSVMTVTMAFSNMAGLYPAVVHAAGFTDYFDGTGASYVPKPDGGAGITTTLGTDITAPESKNIKVTTPSTLDFNGKNIVLNQGYLFYVEGATLTITSSGTSGGLPSNTLMALAGGNIEIQGGTFNKIAVGGYDTQSSLSVSGGHIEELQVGRNVSFNHTGGTIRTIESTASGYHGINFNPGGGSGLMNACLVTSDSYTLPACTFTPPANKVFDKWSVNNSLKNAGDTIALGGSDFSTTITATWKDTTTSNTQPATPAATNTTSSSSYSSYDDDDDYEAPDATGTTAALVYTNGTVATPDIALPTYTGRYKPTLTNNTGENPRAGLLTASGQAVFTFKTTSGEDDSFDHFQGAQMDGQALNPGEYDVTRGSTIITLTKEYIDSLDGGTHTLTMIFDDETVTVPFTKAGLLKSSPKMGED